MKAILDVCSKSFEQNSLYLYISKEGEPLILNLNIPKTIEADFLLATLKDQYHSTSQSSSQLLSNPLTKPEVSDVGSISSALTGTSQKEDSQSSSFKITYGKHKRSFQDDDTRQTKLSKMEQQDDNSRPEEVEGFFLDVKSGEEKSGDNEEENMVWEDE